ncbi:MAG: helicase-exonuclease AddAB subunit AddA [Clostridia bacterium]|jgi:ATP-dependent helicase/nuclease subunit A
MATKWTHEQIKAIETRGANILVSAAAGAGKTAVLVERILRKITDQKNPTDINRLLTVTFTNAAASEMKERVKNRLYEMLEKDPENEGLQRQFALMEKANIMTIHSFCNKVIHENFHFLNPDSDFRLADASESSMIFYETLDRLFEDLYTEDILPGFTLLVDTFGYGKDDRRLKALVETLYEFTRSCPDTVKTLEKAVEEYRVNESFEFSRTFWGKILIGHIKDNLEYVLMEMEGLIETLESIPTFLQDAETLKSDAQQISGIIEQLAGALKGIGCWDDLLHLSSEISFKTLKRIKGEYDEEIREQVKRVRQNAKDTIALLTEKYLSWSNEQIREVMNKQYPVLKTLCRTVRLLEEAFSEEKKKRRLLDFSDLEHMALKVLYEETPEGMKPSPIAREYSETFEEILIDEYQDSNYVQEAILTAVSKNSSNIFMVGDVKQSIYRFRQSVPLLFLEKFATYSEDTKTKKPGILIKLYKNFRSENCIIDAVNRIFERIMTGGMFEIDYTEEEKLIPKSDRTEPVKDDEKTEIIVVDTSRLDEIYKDEEKPQNCIPEAHVISKIIKEMTGSGYEIFDAKKNEYRKVEYKDFAVLTRVKTNWAEPFTAELNKCGIPAYCDVGGGYYDTVEVNTALALLRIIDNPLQDIYLTAVLLSPIGDFTEEEVAKIRLTDRENTVYSALKSYGEKSHEEIPKNLYDPLLAKKTRSFLERLKKWRELAGEIPVDELLWHLYVETGYLDYVTALPEGLQRNGNLKLLYEKAKGVKKLGWSGVYQFLRYIDKAVLSEADSPGTVTLGENENVVRVMSIHKSKGLEFPVVFVAGCGKGFNLRTKSSLAVIHHKYGIGADYVDPVLRFTCTTLQKEALLIKHKEESLAEEMRILYVAATRAKNKLFFVGCSKDIDGVIEKCRLLELLNIRRVPQSFLAHGKSFLEWILYGVWKNPRYQITEDRISYEFSDFIMKIIEPSVPDPEEEETAEETAWPEPDPSVMKNVKSLLDWEYPYQDYAKIPAKITVTELKRMGNEESSDEDTPLVREDPAFKEPSFLSEDNRYLDYGNTVHYIYQHIDIEKFKNDRSREKITETIDDLIRDMVSKKIIREDQASVINSRRLADFFFTRPGRRWLDAKEYRREMPFYLLLDPAEYYAFKGEALCDSCEGMPPILMQGIIDLWYKDEEGITVVDYKTDRIFENVTETFLERYGVQLSLYKKALERITGEKVNNVYIYAVSIMRLISF